MNRSGFFTFEGIDGCGKSTQISAVARLLQERGFSLIVTREPGGTPLSEKIRSVIMDRANAQMCDECEVLLYLASRAQHVREKIVPALRQGMIVLCDRFQEATFAYQGYGRGVSIQKLKEINTFATDGLNPDCTFIFDITVDLSVARRKAMNKSGDRIEDGSREFFERIRSGYRELAASDPKRYVIIDGAEEIGKITGEVVRRIELFIG